MTRAWQPLWTMPDGRSAYIRDNEDGTYTVWSTQENDEILDRNKAMANHNSGWSPTKELRREGSIPLGLIQKWKQEQGVNVLERSGHDYLRRVLNDIDYQHLRTSPGRT